MTTDDGLAPVQGLVDNKRAAALLGVPVSTFKVWATRAKTAKAGIAAQMPQPVATMHGHVYRLEDIEEFGRKIAQSARAPRTVQRALGAYFTPESAAEMMVRWALRPGARVLEPSLGDGQFALAARRFAESQGWEDLDLHACELDPDTARRAVQSGAVRQDRIHVGDFLAIKDLPPVDAVVGNPPYVRIRDLPPVLRATALAAAREAMGEEMDYAGSVWVPFVAKCTALLRHGGRLALVLPADFTYVRYARPLWKFLANSFGRLEVLRFQERVFPEILQNVLILLCSERGGATETVELLARERIAELHRDGFDRGVSVNINDVVAGLRVFQHALLPQETREAIAMLHASSTPARSRVKFNIGYVSGNKKFFHPSTETIEALSLPSESLVPSVVSSRQLSSAPLNTSSMSPVAHLWLPGDKLTPGERKLIAAGEREGVDMAYKCRIRKPWYKVPGVRVPDIFLTTFSDRPRLHVNDAGWVATNSVLGGFARPNVDIAAFVSSWYTPFTLLSIELEVHSLGGGVMIAVPGEADAVRLLDEDKTLAIDQGILDEALRSGDMERAYDIGSESVRRLVGQDGLSAIWKGVETLEMWRKSQSKSS